MEIVETLLNGNRRSLAKAISLVENEEPNFQSVLKELYPFTGKAYILGFTGPPGSGKSSLVDSLIGPYRRSGFTVGIIAVDPTSPFTGGALLGDRIRMQKHFVDDGVFIRSMGTRGNLGGLARATRNVVKVMDAFGIDLIIIETVGVGQSEVDIVKIADTTILLLTPAGGDSIQTIKAGVMEIADIYVVNKSDLPQADRTRAELELMLELKPREKWQRPIVNTTTYTGEGIKELREAIATHRNYLVSSGEFKLLRKKRIRQEVLENLERLVKDKVWEQVLRRDDFEKNVEKILNKENDPYSYAENFLTHLRGM
jgi:LAO/AO transport system kinase